MKPTFLRLLAFSTIALAAACAPTDDDEYREGLLAISSMRVEQVSPRVRSVVSLAIVLDNKTASTINNVTYVTIGAGPASAKFDVEGLRGSVCPLEDRPWDVAPGKSGEIRMWADLSADPAVLDVACQRAYTNAFGFDATKARRYEAPREGAVVPDAFAGPWTVKLEATLDDVTDKARASASASPISP